MYDVHTSTRAHDVRIFSLIRRKLAALRRAAPRGA